MCQGIPMLQCDKDMIVSKVNSLSVGKIDPKMNNSALIDRFLWWEGGHGDVTMR